MQQMEKMLPLQHFKCDTLENETVKLIQINPATDEASNPRV